MLPRSKLDKDQKIPVYFFGSHVHRVEITNVEKIFTPFPQHALDQHQLTNMLGALEMAFKDNVKRNCLIGKPKCTLFAAITNGAPTPKKKMKST